MPLRFVLLFCLTLAFADLSPAADEPDDDLVQMVVDLLGETDKDLRALGLDQVRTEARGQAATEQFAAELLRLAPEAQVGLLRALADRGDKAARPAVMELLESTTDPAVRVAALCTLGPLGGAADAPRLVGYLASTSEQEQGAARSSLVRLAGQDVAAAILAEMQSSSAPVRVTLLEVLTIRRALGAVPDMLSLAVDFDPAVRGAAMTALGLLAGPEQVAAMLPAVLAAQPGPEREAAEKAVMLVCLRTKDPEQRAAPLLAGMQGLAEAEQTALLPALGRVGGPAAMEVVEAALADADPQRHQLGLRALCNWPDASIAPRLYELAQTAADPGERAQALAALIRVAPLPDKRPPAEKLAWLQKALALCTQDEERGLIVRRARAVRTVETLRFLTPYLDQPAFAQQAAESIVELAHQRELRTANKAEFHAALDKVLQTSQDATLKERATRYQNNQTWARPTPPPQGLGGC